jgi:hypothetical protein
MLQRINLIQHKENAKSIIPAQKTEGFGKTPFCFSKTFS